jgi:hypothetical protein
MKSVFFCIIFVSTINALAQNTNWGTGLPITVTVNGTYLDLSVYDPIIGSTKTTSLNVGSNPNYQNADGIVAAISSSSGYMNVAIYDINLHAFITNYWSSTTSTFSNFLNSDGVVAWTNSNYADAAIYDPLLQAWQHNYWSSTTSTFSDFSNSNGVVAWTNSNYADAAVYDASLQAWQHNYWSSTTSTFSNFSNSNGVVAWTNDNYTDAAVYDPSLQSWQHTYWSSTTSTFSNFSNNSGIVAWTNSNYVDGAVYDPSLQTWKHTYWSASTSTFSNFLNTDGTITYTNSSGNNKYGYNINSQSWQSNYNTDLYCKMFASKSSGQAPLITYFWCLTIGANSYSYNCGDGHTVTRRWAWKQYNNSGTYNPTLTIFNSSQNSTCNAVINVNTGITEETTPNFQIFPNPFSSSTTLQINKTFNDATLKVYNSYGLLVKQISKFTEQKITLHRDNLPCGLYFIRMTQDNKLITTKKLVITD